MTEKIRPDPKAYIVVSDMGVIGAYKARDHAQKECIRVRRYFNIDSKVFRVKSLRQHGEHIIGKAPDEVTFVED